MSCRDLVSPENNFMEDLAVRVDDGLVVVPTSPRVSIQSILDFNEAREEREMGC